MSQANRSEFPYDHPEDVRDAMRIRQEIDGEIADLYKDRAISDCAGFIFDYLTETTNLLDCGCGPGTISVQFAEKCLNGHVTGIDANSTHVALSQDLAAKHSLSNTTFQEGDLYELPFADNTFDVAFTHTVLCNLRDPVAALKEMHRVVKPGGIIASREPDYFSSIIYPENPKIFYGLGALASVQTGYSDSTIGRKLRQYYNQAGLTNNKVSASCDTYSTRDQLGKIAHYLKSQLTAPDVCESLKQKNLANDRQVKEFCDAMDDLAASPDAMYVYTLIELVAVK